MNQFSDTTTLKDKLNHCLSKL